MSTPDRHERVEQRADELLPEEAAAGSDDPEAQAAAVLADSDERQASADGTGRRGERTAAAEHRSSDVTVEP